MKRHGVGEIGVEQNNIVLVRRARHEQATVLRVDPQELAFLDMEVFLGHLHDLGKLLFAFVMLHAYLAFSQYLLTWSANLPEEIPWFIVRTTGWWGARRR